MQMTGRSERRSRGGPRSPWPKDSSAPLATTVRIGSITSRGRCMLARAGNIPAADPRRNYLAHRDAIDEAVRRVLESGWYILGKEVTAFESEFAAYVGIGHAIGVGSGTEALHLALRVLG